jgi:hypothetical protein
MEALNAMPSLVDDMGLFTHLRSPAIHHRASLYANDLVFLVPTEQDIQLVHGVMEIFVGVLGLHTNISKCQFTPIRCPEDHMAIMQQRLLQCLLVHFPCRYLAVPLSVYKLSKADMQPLVNAVAHRLSTWESQLMSQAGRTTLTKVTLSTIPIHISIVVLVSPSIPAPSTKSGTLSFGLALTWCKVDVAWLPSQQ